MRVVSEEAREELADALRVARAVAAHDGDLGLGAGLQELRVAHALALDWVAHVVQLYAGSPRGGRAGGRDDAGSPAAGAAAAAAVVVGGSTSSSEGTRRMAVVTFWW